MSIFKTIFAVLSIIFGIYCFVPYIIDIFKNKTKPHIYTWLVWAILQITGALIMISKGAGLGSVSLGLGGILCLYIVFLSFKYGTRHITRFDTICFIGALISIGVWVFLKDPIISIILIVCIDFIGFIPTIKKSYFEPETETSSTYIISSISTLFALGSVGDYNFSTIFYLISIIVTNFICAGVILYGKKNKK